MLHIIAYHWINQWCCNVGEASVMENDFVVDIIFTLAIAPTIPNVDALMPHIPRSALHEHCILLIN